MDDSMDLHIESGESWKNSSEGVTEEAIQKIREEERQAKQVAQQLKRSKAANNQFAKFLSFLMKNISDDELIKKLYDTFYTATDEKTQITYLRKNTNIVVLCGLFYPFFMEEASKYYLNKLFDPLMEPTALTIKTYIIYLQRLSNKFHDNIPLNQVSLMELIILIAKNFLQKVSDAPQLPDPQSFAHIIQGYLENK